TARPLGDGTSIAGVPMSKSGPAFSPQLALPARQPKTSCSVNCLIHLIAPDGGSKATMASAVGCAGALYVMPVAAYTRLRFTSVVGADQIPTPAGPHSSSPAAFFPADFGSGTRNVRHTTVPDFASSALRLPRSVHHAQPSSPATACSMEDTGRKRRP